MPLPLARDRCFREVSPFRKESHFDTCFDACGHPSRKSVWPGRMFTWFSKQKCASERDHNNDRGVVRTCQILGIAVQEGADTAPYPRPAASITDSRKLQKFRWLGHALRTNYTLEKLTNSPTRCIHGAGDAWKLAQPPQGPAVNAPGRLVMHIGRIERCRSPPQKKREHGPHTSR